MERSPSPSTASKSPRRDLHLATASQARSSYSENEPLHQSDHSSPRQTHPDPWQTASDRTRQSMNNSKNEEDVDEQSPLLRPWTGVEVEEGPILPAILTSTGDYQQSFSNDELNKKEASKSSWYLFLLSIAFGGLQIAWSVEFSNGSPFLLRLGISKSLLAIVWIAGPLSGTLVQPYVGIISDRCRSRFGKRRPFMVGGAVATIVSLLLLAWTREIVGTFLSIFDVSKDSKSTKTTAVIFAVFMVYILDFSINVIQATLRAFVVDNAPTHQQDAANAWASRMLGIGNITGYLFGYANLPKYMWFFGDTQFKDLAAIASVGITVTVTISCCYISERDARLEGQPSEQKGGVFAFLGSLLHSMRRLPSQIKRVCAVQLAAWLAWFPFLFYITTYVGQIYVDPIFRENPDMTDAEIDEAWERGTRVGTFALLIYAIVTFVASVVLPWFITSPYKAPESPLTRPVASPVSTRTLRRRTSATLSRSSTMDDYLEVELSDTHDHVASGDPAAESGITKRNWLEKLGARVQPLQIPWLTLKRAWLISQLLFTLLTWLTFIATNTTIATILTGLIGIPWAMTMWVPYALIAAEIRKRDNSRRDLTRPRASAEEEPLTQEDDLSEDADETGAILGIHNVAIAAPQIVATLVSSAIFRALQKPRGTADDGSVAWVLRFGGLMMLVAAWLTRRIREDGDPEDTPPKW